MEEKIASFFFIIIIIKMNKQNASTVNRLLNADDDGLCWLPGSLLFGQCKKKGSRRNTKTLWERQDDEGEEENSVVGR